MRKQVAIYVSVEEHRALMIRAGQTGMPVCRMLYEWIKPKIDATRANQKFDEAELHEEK